jgi:cardiolipin synthase A/B
VNDIWRDLLHLRADVTAAIGLVLAIGTTVHILLRKREVASAVGWIGLVWFAPILGAISYALFGVNRVRSRARQLRLTDDDPDSVAAVPYSRGEPEGMDPLSRGIGRITARPLLAGTQVTIYQNGDAAYPPMLAAIEAAKSSVGLSSYIFRNDAWGGRFIVALIDAKRRGVEVRVLIDGIGGGWLLSPTYRPLHALPPPLADAVYQPAQPQEGPGVGRNGCLYRRYEHRRRERNGHAAEDAGARSAF